MSKKRSRVYPGKPLIGVGAAVFRDDSALLIKRGNSPLYGTWSLPGGRVKPFESLKDAAVREVKEECGIDIDVLDLIKLFEYIERGPDGRVKYHYIVFDFNAVYAEGMLKQSSDALEARWVHIDELCRYGLTDAVVDVIKKGAHFNRT